MTARYNEIKGFAVVIKKYGAAYTRVWVYQRHRFTARSIARQKWRVHGIVTMIVTQKRKLWAYLRLVMLCFESF